MRNKLLFLTTREYSVLTVQEIAEHEITKLLLLFPLFPIIQGKEL